MIADPFLGATMTSTLGLDKVIFEDEIFWFMFCAIIQTAIYLIAGLGIGMNYF